MSLARGIKRPIEILCKRVSNPIHSGFGYSMAHKRPSISEFSEIISISSNSTSASCGLGIFVRRYSSDVSASEQMSLIKKLRERTSAPIKDVKSALVASNWDIGKFKEHFDFIW